MPNLQTVTVVLPIRNEADFIARSLGAVLNQDYPAHLLQILVSDGMSTDNTRALIAEMAQQHPDIALAVLDNPKRIVPTAFNIALQHATGDIVMLVSGHCEIASDYVSQVVKAMQASHADNVGGRMNSVGTTPVSRAIALATSSPFGVGNARYRYATKPGWVDTVYLGAYRRDILSRIGGYDEELVRNQDDELNFRLTQAGGKIWFDPAIKSTYYNRASLSKLWTQYFQYGLYKVLVMKKRGGVASWRHLAPVTFIVLLALSLVLGLAVRLPLLMGVLAVPYLAGNLLASLWTARRDWPTVPYLPPAFAALHFGYGLGWLAGFWKWRGRSSISVTPAAHTH